jgi:hypothetical protein
VPSRRDPATACGTRGQARPGLTTRVRPQQAGPGSRAAGNNAPRRPEHAPHPGFRRGDVEATGFAFSLPVATVSGNAAGELLDILLELTRDRVTGIPFDSRGGGRSRRLTPPDSRAVRSSRHRHTHRTFVRSDGEDCTSAIADAKQNPGICTDRADHPKQPAALHDGSDSPISDGSSHDFGSPRLAGLRGSPAGRCRHDAGAPAHHEALRADVIGVPA